MSERNGTGGDVLETSAASHPGPMRVNGPVPDRPAGPDKRGPDKRRPGNRWAGRFGQMLRRLLILILLIVLILPLALVAMFRFVGPPLTPLMLIRLSEGHGIERRWVPLADMPASLPRAVIAGEDAHFCSHHGFDFEAIEKAVSNNNKRPGKIRGGSTISQQTAKNVFLWPDRSFLRKGLEAGFTVLIELGWGKARIMEIYLNSIEWGPGVYGADAAARHHFGVGVRKLTSGQSARLAAIIPSPLKWRAAAPGPYVKARSRRIGGGARTVDQQALDACVVG